MQFCSQRSSRFLQCMMQERKDDKMQEQRKPVGVLNKTTSELFHLKDAQLFDIVCLLKVQLPCRNDPPLTSS